LIRTFIQNGYRSINYRIKANHADGSSQILMTQSQGVLDDGRLVRIWVSWRDITHLGDEAGAVSGAGQYRNSSLTPSEIQEYIDLIERIMKTDRPYLDSTFNLAKLSKLVRVPDYQLSQVLNVGMKTSFYDLVNQYRVESLTELMTSPALDPISILDLAYRVGFNSKSTFNTAFKKITGKTPSVYRAEKQAERASGIRQKVPSF
jgi:AraC-like DNA-binding protein